MKSFSRVFFSALVVAILFASCKASKHPPCRTCPKWDDSMHITANMPYEEQH